MAEGRDGGGDFDAASYANRYADLYAAFGYDLPALYNHYQTFGINEGRNSASQTAAPVATARRSTSTASAPSTSAPSTSTPSTSTPSTSTPSTDSTPDTSTPSTDNTTGVETPSTDTTTGTETPSTDSTTGVETPSTDSNTGAETPSTDSNTEAETPSTDSTTGTETPSTDSTTEENTPATDDTTTDNTTTDNTQAFIEEVVALVNQERAAQGLSALTVDTTLQSAAMVRAEEIVTLFSHTRPDYTSCFTVLQDFEICYTAAGENIAMGQTSPQEVMTAWMNSEGHRANILTAEYTHIGIGYYEDENGYDYWVQLFIRQ